MSKKKAPKLADIMEREQDIKLVSAKQPVPEKEPQAMERAFAAQEVQKKVKPITLTVYLHPKVKRQLEEVWFNERHEKKSQNDILIEGLDRVFKHRGLPSVEQLIKEE